MARTHDDPAVKGVDVTAQEIEEVMTALQIGMKDAIAMLTGEVQREAIQRWEASASQAKGHAAGKHGYRAGHRTQRYREAIRKTFFDEGMTGRVFVAPMRGYGPGGAKLRPKNLPLWLEYGTAKMYARPHLIPAYERARTRLDAAAKAVIAKAKKG